MRHFALAHEIDSRLFSNRSHDSILANHLFKAALRERNPPHDGNYDKKQRVRDDHMPRLAEQAEINAPHGPIPVCSVRSV